MKKCFYFSCLIVSFFGPIVIQAQPFIDLVNANVQNFRGTYVDSSEQKNLTTDYNLNFFLPKVFKNGNTFMLRGGAEEIASTIDSSHYNLYSFSMPIGIQFVNKRKNWKMLLMGIPKINSDLKDDLSKDIQLGGTTLFTWVKNDSCKLKFGVFYNREYWGNFFVPLVGIDWKATKHVNIYGILPNNMRVEYSFGDGFYAGIGFKNNKRSFRLSSGFDNDYVQVKETQIKLFLEWFVWKKIIFFAEGGYGVNYSFVEYDFSEKNASGEDLIHLNHPVYTPMNKSFLFNAGFAYRLRLD